MVGWRKMKVGWRKMNKFPASKGGNCPWTRSTFQRLELEFFFINYHQIDNMYFFGCSWRLNIPTVLVYTHPVDSLLGNVDSPQRERDA